MLQGSIAMDVANGMKTGDGINGMNFEGGVQAINDVNIIDGLKTGNGIMLINDKKIGDNFNGVAHTQIQAADLAKALVEGIISLEKL